MAADPRESDFIAVQTNPSIGDRGKMHVYGADPSAQRPYVLVIHGGGWCNGDQTAYAWMWPRMASLGFALALPSYRLAPQFRFPCAYDDLVHLLSWLSKNGASCGLDPARCLLFGGSAGAHLAMLLATRALKEKNSAPEIRGAAVYCGPVDFAAQYAFETAAGRSSARDFMGATPEAEPSRYRDASPICHIHDRMPPVWMAHGASDDIVSVAQSRDMVRALAAAGCDPVYLEARGLGHTGVETDPQGKVLEPYQLLFEQDLFRFMSRMLS